MYSLKYNSRFTQFSVVLHSKPTKTVLKFEPFSRVNRIYTCKREISVNVCSRGKAKNKVKNNIN